MKEIKGKLINGEIRHAHGLEDIVNMSILPKLIYKLNAIPIKMSAKLLVDKNKIILKYYGKTRN